MKRFISILLALCMVLSLMSTVAFAADGVSYVVPQHIHADVNEDVTLKFRVRSPIKNAVIEIMSGDVTLSKLVKTAVIPSEMNLIKISKDKMLQAKDTITVKVYAR